MMSNNSTATTPLSNISVTNKGPEDSGLMVIKPRAVVGSTGTTCPINCKNGGSLKMDTNGQTMCSCVCPSGFVGRDCGIKKCSPGFEGANCDIDSKKKCEVDSQKFWNGSECITRNAGTCAIKNPAYPAPKCVEGEGDSPFWYVNTGGPNKWTYGGEAECAASKEWHDTQENKTYKQYDSAKWGKAPCIYAVTEAECKIKLSDIGC
jgi:hypothetical protein